MPITPHSFKRLVLGLQGSAPNRTMRLAVELAELLDLELLGLFLEETGLRDLASLPFAREFRPLGGGWRPINPERLSHDLELAARSAERMFTEAVKRIAANKRQFEVIRAPTVEAIASVSRSSDIVLIVEPVSAAERASQQFTWLIEAAFRSAAAVMLAPTPLARGSGPIVAIAGSSDDPSIPVAATIATAAKEGVVILHAYEGAADEPGLRKLGAETGPTVIHIVADKTSLLEARELAPTFRQLRERLVVMTRGVFGHELALSIAALRRVPVLVIAPPEANLMQVKAEPKSEF